METSRRYKGIWLLFNFSLYLVKQALLTMYSMSFFYTFFIFYVSRSLIGDFIFIFSFLFNLFFFLFLFLFLFLEQLRLGFISHTVTSVTRWCHSHKTDHRTGENGVEDSRIKWCHTAWTTHVGLMSYTWSLG